MATATLIKPKTQSELVDLFMDLESALNAEIVERPNEIHGLNVALVAAVHMFLLGTPGLAKSMLVDRALPRIALMKLFKIVLAATTPPEEEWGPLDVAALAESHYRYMTEGYLPWCDVAFIDEIWKCNSALLNAKLGILNEREFKNDGKIIKVPLRTMLCASNELPANESLAAIYDRIPLRYEVGDIVEDGAFQQMLETEIDEFPAVIMEWDDVLEAQQQAAALPISKQVYITLTEMRRELRELNIFPTPRRWKQALKILRAEAWLDGADSVEVEHLSILQHAFWDRPDQRAPLATLVMTKVNPLERETMALATEVEKIGKEIDVAVRKKDDQYAHGREIHTSINDANNDLQALMAKAGSSRRQQAMLTQLRERLHALTVRMITEIFHLPIEGMDLGELAL